MFNVPLRLRWLHDGDMTEETAIAFRATSYWGQARWGRGNVRKFRYDARFPDGHEEYDVSYDAALNAGKYPADAHVVRTAAEAACPETGVGPWVDYPWGQPLPR